MTASADIPSSAIQGNSHRIYTSNNQPSAAGVSIEEITLYNTAISLPDSSTITNAIVLNTDQYSQVRAGKNTTISNSKIKTQDSTLAVDTNSAITNSDIESSSIDAPNSSITNNTISGLASPISNVYIFSNNKISCTKTSYATTNPQSIFSNNVLNECGIYINVHTGGSKIIAGNIINNAPENGVFMENESSDNIIVSINGNTIRNPKQFGINVSTTSNSDNNEISISNNLVFHPGSSGIYNAHPGTIINGNHSSYYSKYGIINTANDVIITGNSARYGSTSINNTGNNCVIGENLP